MTTFAHFILTRFNLKRNAHLPPNWLRDRIKLFEEYCLPSIVGQTCKNNLYWILMCENSSLNRLEDSILLWQSLYKGIIPAWCNRFKSESMGNCVKPLIESYAKELKATHIITTRLDNDDALASKFIERTQQTAKEIIERGELPKAGIVLDHPLGFRLDNANKKLYLWNRPYNPFLSLIRPANASYKTVYSFPGGHGQVAQYAEVKRMEPHPAWLQVLHDKNISNKLRGVEKEIELSELENYFSEKYYLETLKHLAEK